MDGLIIVAALFFAACIFFAIVAPHDGEQIGE
jgi:hypothetical protein